MEPLDLTIDLNTLKGKSALITGGASGIGLATTQKWAEAGVYVTIADLQQPTSPVSNESSQYVHYVHCDVTSWKSQLAAFKQALAFSPTGTLDIVACFAGTNFAPGNQVDHVMAAGPPKADVDPPRPDTRNIEINLVGSYYTSWLGLYYLQILGPETEEPRDKSLIFCASIAAYMDSPKASTYPASKFGIRGLFRSTRAQSQQMGVRCNLLAPWFVDTPLIAPIKNAMAARGVDMAKAISFTTIDSCVEAASYCVAKSEVHGRALAIQPEGTFDLKDDMEHGWGGDQLRPIMQRRRDAGFDA